MPEYQGKGVGSIIIEELVQRLSATNYNFADPENNDLAEVEYPLLLIRYHYASWFMLIGFYEIAVQLVSGEDVQIEKPEEQIEYDGHIFYILGRGLYYHHILSYIDSTFAAPISKINPDIGG